MFLVLKALLFCALAFAAGNDFMGDLMSPPGMSRGPRARYEYRHYGNAGMNHESFELRQSKFDVSTPLVTEENSQWRAHASADYDSINTKALFPNGRQLPNRLWDIGAGLTHSRTVQGDRTLGGNFTVGSASDRPFGAGRDLGFSLNLTYKVPQENEAAWIFFVSMSNTRGFLNYLPLPGVAYAFKAGERTRLVLGIPFLMIFWRPLDPWIVTFMYFPIRTVELRVAYGSPRGLQPYALASFRSRNFRIYDRAEKEERLFNDEGLLQAGLNLPVQRWLAFDLGGGLSFERKYFLAKKLTHRGSSPLITAENAVFGHFKATASF
jgi:hypothetical protein